jgi:hypothetical protein
MQTHVNLKNRTRRVAIIVAAILGAGTAARLASTVTVAEAGDPVNCSSLGPWDSDTTYKKGAVVFSGDAKYRCRTARCYGAGNGMNSPSTGDHQCVHDVCPVGAWTYVALCQDGTKP